MKARTRNGQPRTARCKWCRHPGKRSTCPSSTQIWRHNGRWTCTPCTGSARTRSSGIPAHSNRRNLRRHCTAHNIRDPHTRHLRKHGYSEHRRACLSCIGSCLCCKWACTPSHCTLGLMEMCSQNSPCTLRIGIRKIQKVPCTLGVTDCNLLTPGTHHKKST